MRGSSLLPQFMPQVVTKDEFCLMRASFLLTHQIGPEDGFEFTEYITRWGAG